MKLRIKTSQSVLENITIIEILEGKEALNSSWLTQDQRSEIMRRRLNGETLSVKVYVTDCGEFIEGLDSGHVFEIIKDEVGASEVYNRDDYELIIPKCGGGCKECCFNDDSSLECGAPKGFSCKHTMSGYFIKKNKTVPNHQLLNDTPCR